MDTERFLRLMNKDDLGYLLTQHVGSVIDEFNFEEKNKARIHKQQLGLTNTNDERSMDGIVYLTWNDPSDPDSG
jgi:hypothetical protein